METIIEVTGGRGGSAFLLLGEEKTALMDCGMAYCASNLIHNCREILGVRPLDYIIISHSHYDHIGAIPYLRQEWPSSRVLGAEYAKRILTRPNALKTIRYLSVQAAETIGAGELPPYDDTKLAVDQVIAEGDWIDLGGMGIQVMETPGHTQCSLSFLVNGDTLFASETTGCFSHSGKVNPAFIRSYSDTIAAIHTCQKLNPRFIISPHYGLVSQRDTPGYWRNCLRAATEARAFILDLAQQGYNEEQILMQYEKVFRDEHNRIEQPVDAFRLNTEFMIKTVLREPLPTLSIAK